MKDKKKIVIGILCALIMIMAVGYALLSQQLSITGSTSITSNWQVEITNITEKEKSTGATTNNTNYTATTASFNTSLTSPGDYALYEVTVTNKGTLDAVLSAKPTVTTGNNEAIQYELEGIKKGDKILKNNQTDTFTIKVQYNPSTTTQPSTLTSDIQVTLNYQQDLGQVSPYDGYAIGDVITFNNANWRVIKESGENEDYVTLMKETMLIHNELGNYAITYVCPETLPYSGYDYCSTGGEIKEYDTMEYYWNTTCHNRNVHGYTNSDTSGCTNHNDYAGSKIKEFLEGTYINTLGADKLKEVDGYKIRLITLEELELNLGYEKQVGTDLYSYSSTNTPAWVKNGFGKGSNSHSNVFGYWTMSGVADSSSGVWVVGDVYIYGYYPDIYYTNIGVRPVINLLKSAIE